MLWRIKKTVAHVSNLKFKNQHQTTTTQSWCLKRPYFGGTQYRETENNLFTCLSSSVLKIL